jgi:hypothetical protein
MNRRLLALLAPLALPACPAVEGKLGDDTGAGPGADGRDGDDGLHGGSSTEVEPAPPPAPTRWTEYRSVVVENGCVAEVWGRGVEVSADRPDLVATCPECELIFEVRTDIDVACEDTTPVQVVDPYYRGLSRWGEDTVDIWFGMQPPHYEAAGFSFLTEGAWDAGAGELTYGYEGDLGVEGGLYRIDARATLE